MTSKEKTKFTITGGGPGGTVMACYLGRAGYRVEVYERRGDLRSGKIPGGRSINLALSLRGIHALEEIGVGAEVMRTAISMRGRMIHSPTGKLTFQPYGTEEGHAIHSVSRGGLNSLLLDAADRFANVRLFFDRKCETADLGTGEITVVHTESGERSRVAGDVLIGADGAFSVVRGAMQRMDRFDYSQDYLAHGFKEMTIPAGGDGEFVLEKNALHIWPRRSFMMIALPNADGSFTCTLFWPFAGPISFAAIQTGTEIRGFFERHFPDAVGLMPMLVEDYRRNAVGSLVTVRCHPWNVGGKVALVGDACHAVVPFYGQGMNAAFEDCTVLNECLDRYGADFERAFDEYTARRKENVDTLADKAIANFLEMRDHTGQRMFLLGKQTEKALHRVFPWWYTPLYSMMTFTRMPYTEAVRRAKRQDRVAMGTGIVLVLAVLIVILGLVMFR